MRKANLMVKIWFHQELGSFFFVFLCRICAGRLSKEIIRKGKKVQRPDDAIGCWSISKKLFCSLFFFSGRLSHTYSSPFIFVCPLQKKKNFSVMSTFSNCVTCSRDHRLWASLWATRWAPLSLSPHSVSTYFRYTVSFVAFGNKMHISTLRVHHEH